MDLVEQVAKVIKEQVIEWACENGMTNELLDDIVAKEIIPIVERAERESICLYLIKHRCNLIDVVAIADGSYSKEKGND